MCEGGTSAAQPRLCRHCVHMHDDPGGRAPTASTPIPGSVTPAGASTLTVVDVGLLAAIR